MKVMFINTVCGSGSVGRLVTGLMDALSERGIPSLAAYGQRTAPEGYDTFRIGSTPEIYLHGALCRITDRHGLYSGNATRRLVRRIREYDPDILHLHNVHGYYVNIRILFDYLRREFSRKPGKRIVWTLHDCWTFTGHCAHFSYIGCEKWKTFCRDCPQKEQYPRTFLMDGSSPNYRLKKALFTGIPGVTLVTPSEWLREVVKDSFMRDYPVRVVPTGIDLTAFRPVQSDLREKYGIGNRPLLLGVANPWRERKGYGDFLELARRLQGSCVIAMVGLKKSQCRGLPSNVIGIGRVNGVQEMAEWYSAADLYVNLTLEDTFPTTNLESMACGTPVVTYAAGGSPESLTEETGRVVPCSDLEEAVKSIRELLSDGIDRKEACRKRAEEYSAGKRFREYLDQVYGL